MREKYEMKSIEESMKPVWDTLDRMAEHAEKRQDILNSVDDFYELFMKKIIFLVLSLVFFVSLFSQLSLTQANDVMIHFENNESMFKDERNIETVYVGDPNSQVFANNPPFDLNNWWSYAQTIYTAEELNISGGVINKIEYTFQSYGDIYEPVLVNISMANVDKDFDEFDTSMSWLPWNSFTYVFSSDIWLSLPAGTYNIPISLYTPFHYTGGNLVILTERVIDWDNWHHYYHRNNAFLQTNYSGKNRSSVVGGRGTPPDEINGGWLTSNTANMKLTVNTNGFGSLEGIVSLEGISLEGIEISILGTPRKTFTNGEGFYSLIAVTPGIINIRAYKIEYAPLVINNVLIHSNATTTQNIELIPADEIVVFGKIISSYDNQPFVGASVFLSGGGAEFPIVFSDSEGRFTIPNVYINHTYTIKINAFDHIEYLDDDIVVGSSDLYLEEIMIYEIPYPPKNIEAYLYENKAYVRWDAPKSRIFESYNLYKSLVLDIEKPELWINLVTYFTGTEYIDDDVLESPHGYYYYVIEAVFSNDNISPAITAPIKLSDYIFVGDPNSPYRYHVSPFNFQWRSGLSQIIYRQKELYFEGLITEIEYYFTKGTVPDENPIKIWMANVDIEKNSFISNTDWIPFEKFTLVYEGMLYATNHKLFSPIQIILDEPYFYKGENIVLMTFREYDINNPNMNQGHGFQSIGNYQNQVMIINSQNQGVINPGVNDLGTGSIVQFFPNTKFTFELPENEGIRPPRKVKAEEIDDFVLLTWESPVSELYPIGYNIYRAVFVDKDNDDLWISLATNIQGYVFEDFIWNQISQDEYVYIVNAIYENYRVSKPTFSNIVGTTVTDYDDDIPQLKTRLGRNYPNPFNPETIISFDVEVAGNVAIEIFNIRGQKVRTLVNEFLPKGHHEVIWNGENEYGLPVASGVYFYRLQADEQSLTRRMVLLK
ncbi:MAG: T9SS type A sorting domain-containing protein [Candidatus Cloacimonetes bacterium]|nr:T9SS type A sorting domain-containing protein [Candidatus Cloacimonadota bacterium]